MMRLRTPFFIIACVAALHDKNRDVSSLHQGGITEGGASTDIIEASDDNSVDVSTVGSKMQYGEHPLEQSGLHTSKRTTSIKVNRGGGKAKLLADPIMPVSPYGEVLQNRTGSNSTFDSMSSNTSNTRFNPVSLLEMSAIVTEMETSDVAKEMHTASIPEEIHELVTVPPEDIAVDLKNHATNDVIIQGTDQEKHATNEIVIQGKMSLSESQVLSDEMPMKILTGSAVDGTKDIEMLSVYEQLINFYNGLPATTWHTKLAAITFLSIVLIGKIGCVCLCFRVWQRRQEEMAAKNAAKLFSTSTGFSKPVTDTTSLEKAFEQIISKGESKEISYEDDQPAGARAEENDGRTELDEDDDPCCTLGDSVSSNMVAGSITWSVCYSDNGVPCFRNLVTGEKTWNVPDEVTKLAKGNSGAFELPSGCSLNDASDSEDIDLAGTS